MNIFTGMTSLPHSKDPEETGFSLRKTGGDFVRLSKEEILQHLSFYNPNWRETTVTIPCVPDLKYAGPIGFPGVRPDIEESHKGQIKGQMNEYRVLQIYEQYSKLNKLDLTIFHDTKITKSNLNALSKAFVQDCFVMDNNIECEIDFVTVSKYSIVLTEVKSKVGDGKKAFSQLRDAENLVKTILQIVGLQDLKVPILKVIASPHTFRKDLLKKAEKRKVILLNITEKSIECTLSKIFSCGDSPRELNLENFVAALAFLQSCPTFQSEDSQKDNLKKSLLEGAKGMEIVEELKCHHHMKNWNHPESKELCVSRNIFIWLDPIQSFIMSQPNPCQIITGPASSGKTILVQLKVLELMRHNNSEDVLVILPTSELKEKYQEFFAKHNPGIHHEKLVILTSNEFIPQNIPEKNRHIFIDEFCALSERSDEFCKIFETLIKHHSNNPRKLFWITADFKQNQSCLWDIPTAKKLKF